MARQRYRPPHDFGLGGVAIGNEFQFATDEQAEATLAAAWQALRADGILHPDAPVPEGA